LTSGNGDDDDDDFLSDSQLATLCGTFCFLSEQLKLRNVVHIRNPEISSVASQTVPNVIKFTVHGVQSRDVVCLVLISGCVFESASYSVGFMLTQCWTI
jgi:hypothetical protein